MSWLGGSFSSITGQLSNFTKEVLYEGREEVSDHAAELSLANRKVQDFEAECNKLRTEVARLRGSNGQLEERCRTADLQASALLQQSRDLKAQHKAKQATEEEGNEIKSLQERVEELEGQLRECGERHLQQVSALQDHQEERVRQLHNHYLSLTASPSDTFPGERSLSSLNGQENHLLDSTGLSLQSQLSNLEQQLLDSRQKAEFQAQKLREAERSAQRTVRQLEKVQQEKAIVCQNLAQLQESLFASKSQDGEKDKDVTVPPFQEKQDSQEASPEITDEIANLQMKIELLEKQLAQREEELSSILAEKELLDSSLVELDGQHEEAMEQLLVVKDDLQRANKSLQQEMNSLQEQNMCLQTEVETLREQLLLRPAPHSGQIQDSQVTSAKETEGGSLSSILQSVSDISAENLVLEERIDALEKDRQKLEVELFQSEESKQLLEATIIQAKDEASELKENISALEKLHQTALSELELLKGNSLTSCEELQALRKQYEDEVLELKRKLIKTSENHQKELEQLNENLIEKEEQNRVLALERERNIKSEALLASTNNDLLEQALQKSKEEYEKIAVEVASLQQENSTLREDANGKKDLETALLNAKAEREKLEVELLKSNEAKHQLDLEFSKREIDHKQLLSRVAELESIVLEKNSSSDSSYFGDLSQNSDLLTKLQQLTSENENLQNESDDLHVRLMETSGEKERLRVAFEELLEQNNETEGKLQEQSTVMEALELRLEEIEKFHAQGVYRLEQEIETLKSEAASLRLQEEIMIRDNKELQEKCSNISFLQGRVVELELLVEGAQSKSTESVSQQTEELTVSNNTETNFKTRALNDPTVNGIDNVSSIHTEAGVTHSKSEETIDKNVCDLKNLLKKKDSEILTLNCQLESLIMQSEASSNYTLGRESEITALKSQIRNMTEDNENNISNTVLLEQLRKVETEKEQLVVILNEKTRECSNLKAEVHKLVSFVSAEKQALSKLQQDNQELMRKQNPDSGMSKEIIQNLSRIIKDKDIEIEALKQKVDTLVDIAKEEDPERVKVLSELLSERENLSKQLKAYQADREQIALLLNQKHQESLRYHEEMQKMAVRMNSESQRYESLKEQHRSVSQLFEEKQKSLLNTQNEVISLKQRVSELERQHTDLRQKYNGLVEHSSNNNQLNQDVPEETLPPNSSFASALDQDLLMSEKDQMIYDLGQTLRKREDDSLQKDQALVSFQKRMDSLQFQFNETLFRLKEAESECERLKQGWDQMREEKSILGEQNRNLSMTLQKAQAEQEAMRQKMGTLTQVMQTNMLNVESTEVAEGKGTSLTSPQLLLKREEALEAQVHSLAQERDQAQLALSQLQQENADTAQEKNQLQKQNEKLHKELERLRNHLLELQDNFTQEVMVAEEREKELRIRLSQAEDKANLSSSAIISASQEASLRVESLQSQLSRVVRQRDAYLDQISQLEDKVQQQSASNTNLQLALEQIQTAHQRELHERKQKQMLELSSYVQQINTLKTALEHKETQLSDTSEALEAASRLSEQLDRKEEAIGQLREEVSLAHQENRRLYNELKEMQTHTEGKVDKLIMKSLVLNYFMSTPSQRPEMIRLLARMLDFNQEEMHKAGLKMVRESSTMWPGGGWLNNLIHRNTPPASPAHAENAVATTSLNRSTQPSFSALFVQFLETESRPQARLQLPIEEMSEGIVNRQLTRPPMFPLTQLTPIKTITTTTTSTTTVLAEHPLMRPISTALPTFTPVVATEDEAKNSIVFLKDALQ